MKNYKCKQLLIMNEKKKSQITTPSFPYAVSHSNFYIVMRGEFVKWVCRKENLFIGKSAIASL